MSDVTRILDRAQQGDPQAAAELLPLVYDELRKLAAAKMAQQPPGQTLQATALVHEAWLKLTGDLSCEQCSRREGDAHWHQLHRRDRRALQRRQRQFHQCAAEQTRPARHCRRSA